MFTASPWRMLTRLIAVAVLGLGSLGLSPVAAWAAQQATTTTLSISPFDGASVGEQVTFSVTVTAADGTNPADATMFTSWTIWDGGSCGAGTDIVTYSLTQTSPQTFVTTFQSPSTKSYVACYSGHPELFEPSSSAPVSYPVTRPTTTTTLSISPAGGAEVGEQVTFSVTVTAADGTNPADATMFTSWTIWDGGSCGAGTDIVTYSLTQTSPQTFVTTFNSPSTKSYVACYSGHPELFEPSSSTPVSYSVTRPTTTTTLLIRPADGEASVGEQVTFSVTVTAADGGTPAGTWTIWDGGSCGAGSSLVSQPVGSRPSPRPSRKRRRSRTWPATRHRRTRGTRQVRPCRRPSRSRCSPRRPR
ncbi:MAG: hypothetical protein IPL43_02255 [Micropruina sp.]|nr:hypothetical protein [Micropruina sp.]